MTRRPSMTAWLLHASLALVALVALLPFLWMLLLSLQGASTSLSAPRLRWPWPPTS